jgi:hypothetical protein
MTYDGLPQGMIDLHTHSAPSVYPRRYCDAELVGLARSLGFAAVVLKAHEGSTTERAALVGSGAVGGIVLNAAVGGANPDAVRVNAALGGRVVWMPTVSAEAHQAAEASAELSVHRGSRMPAVPVCNDGRLRPEWMPVLEVVAAHDLVLASGHLHLDETVCLFHAAARLGVRRLLVNHPLMPFQGWRADHAAELAQLDAYVEIGALMDHLLPADPVPTERLLAAYPHRLIVVGHDLGHAAFPDYRDGVTAWHRRAAGLIGEAALEVIATANGRDLLGLLAAP